MMGFFHKGILIWESILCYLLQLSLRIQLTLLKIRRTLEFQEQHYQWDKDQPWVHRGFPFQTEDIRPPGRVKISIPTQAPARNIFCIWRPGLGSVCQSSEFCAWTACLLRVFWMKEHHSALIFCLKSLHILQRFWSKSSIYSPAYFNSGHWRLKYKLEYI